eukprot:2467843-Rhodomonas_salina.1
MTITTTPPMSQTPDNQAANPLADRSINPSQPDPQPLHRGPRPLPRPGIAPVNLLCIPAPLSTCSYLDNLVILLDTPSRTWELLTQVLDGKDSRDVGIDEFSALAAFVLYLSLIHISEPTRPRLI